MVLDLNQLCDLLEIPPPVGQAGAGTAPASTEVVITGFTGVNTLALAGPSDLCFAERTDQAARVGASQAGAVIVPKDFPDVAGPHLLRTTEPRARFFSIAERFVPKPSAAGIHSSAIVDPSARLADDVAIGPNAVIGAYVSIGPGSVIGAGSVLECGVQLGANCTIEANVTIQRNAEIGSRCILHAGCVIGGDGFGFEWDGNAHRKIPQLGRVVIEDEVEIGCNCCVDRATLGETRIGRGTKIDNLVQIAHNTEIGAHVILISQSGVAGSSRLGTGTVVAGQVAISDHLEIGAGARIGGQSGVTKDVPAGATVFGTPARPIKQMLRELATLAQLPALSKAVKGWGTELAALQQRLSALEQAVHEHQDRKQKNPARGGEHDKESESF
ncbi:UDP-3-O-(3-hydroxymyristoyl)glucosamine N-acyltransferase [Halochromatium salexigens]|uniref:UDP-3-O-acylglucosamine N-acyltransferase n=1 Tax=Halochromatium salexigens TaxID=49447 RepID=A0AAJ0UGT1_HALSE|nr:UDP-3-O-(3-hydroxymyristoyl)glucosamine N-acyltransferase [Halochromatium salexigens]MBK5931182.1 UDP-3-O-(3-hydroxymyristoyl)glucosamine N-acyltransferase [Halochromatium salexigens]